MALTEVYCDPSIAGNSGTGTSGDPYGDIQYMLDTESRDGTNGNRLNVKAGTDEVMAANLDWSTFGTPSASAPVVMQGYTSTAGDGGIFSVDLGGSYNFSQVNHTHYVDFKLHNGPSGDMCVGAYNTTVTNGEFTNGTDGWAQTSANRNNQVINCHFNDLSGTGVEARGTQVISCFFKNGTKDFTQCIQLFDDGACVENCIFSLDGTSHGITTGSERGLLVRHCSFFTSGSGNAIENAFTPEGISVFNCLFEGWSTAIDQTSGPLVYGYNGFFNNTNDTNASFVAAVDIGGNESLGATPFDKSGSDTFANRFTYWAPADTGGVQNGAFPTGIDQDMGAVQHDDPAGGGSAVPFIIGA